MQPPTLPDKYDPQEIEPRWQRAWEQARLFDTPPATLADGSADPRPKAFILEMFPYPSGRLHMGHVRNYAIGDVLARAHRMRGFRVLYPMGWDAFGLPAENAALQAGVHPAAWTEKNIGAMRGPLGRLGQSYDWSRELRTCDPGYYVHEQRLFVEMWRRGLAYRKAAHVNWCPSCSTVLANEQVEDGRCWRCRSEVEPRELVQWFIRTTQYAQELLDGLPGLRGRWPDKVLNMQAAWIGRSEEGEPLTYRLRDWLVSRQRYWGCPIPMVECQEGGHGYQPVPDSELPVRLPEDAGFRAGGRSPLESHPTWGQARCPVCGGPARRETDTMDGFMESSWYFLRFASPRCEGGIVDAEGLGYLPVDIYVGGAEHATKHLIYARCVTRMLSDWGVLPPSMREPFSRLVTQGMVLKDAHRCAEHGYLYPEEVRDGCCGTCGKPAEHLRQMKMSKTSRNVVEPAQIVERYGADTARLFCLFAAPPESDLEWSEEGIEGSSRFLARLHRLVGRALSMPRSATDLAAPSARALRRKTHKTIRRVTQDVFERRQFNTAIAAVMELSNEVLDYLVGSPGLDPAVLEALEAAVLLLAPMAPHLCEELWRALGHPGFAASAPWPVFDEDVARDDEVQIAVQVNGKKRAEIRVSPAAAEPDVRAAALADPNVWAHLDGRQVRKVIFVPGRILNFVVQ